MFDQRVRDAGLPLRHRLAVVSGCAPTSQQHGTFEGVVSAIDKCAVTSMIGPSGVGKTFLATFALYQFMRRPHQALGLYTKFKSMIDEHRDRVFVEKRDVKSWMRRYTRPNLLVIDEIHERRGTNEEELLLGDVIDTRHSAMRPTIIISNLMPDAFEELMGQSVTNRIAEGGRVFRCEGWRDIRKEGVPR